MRPDDVVALAARVRADLEQLRRKQTMAVMFVDLVGSTDYKARHPAEEEWLPRLSRFLLGVTRIVEEHGRVVKYIGDEVMAVFESRDPVVDAENAARSILAFCDELASEEIRVKIALDYGEVSLLNFGNDGAAAAVEGRVPLHALDPQGLVVDRCARLMSKATANAVLCSTAFHAKSRIPATWKRVGEFRPRGIPEPVEVFILQTLDAPDLVVEDEAMTLPECKTQLDRVSTMLQECQKLNRR